MIRNNEIDKLNEKVRIAVLFGGCSSEYHISLQSAYSVITNLSKVKYEVILIGITKDGEWFRYFGKPEDILNDTWNSKGNVVKTIISPSRNDHGLIEFYSGGSKLVPIDIVFPILHGKNGEDGTMQGLLQMAGIPCVGCGVLASSVCKDKDVAHRLVKAAGVEVPSSKVLNYNEGKEKYRTFASEIGYPLFIKPARAGSSLGITKVGKEEELLKAIDDAMKQDSKIIMEKAVEGFEVGCAILGNNKLTVGAVDEIELSQGFFDFEEKYKRKTAKIHMPARISEDVAKKIKDTAETIYRTLDCSGYARVDMFLTADEKVIFNEVNTIPGFTCHSRFPSMLKGIDLSFQEILDNVIGQVIATYEKDNIK